MGYSTEFKGVLRFTKELTREQLVKVKSFCGEDCRDHPEWEDAEGLAYIDLELSADFTGLKWNGAEKTYNMVDVINLIIVNMKKDFPDFGLKGSLFAQGEEFDDVWRLCFNEDDFAEKEDIIITGKRITCPHCEEDFIYEE